MTDASWSLLGFYEGFEKMRGVRRQQVPDLLSWFANVLNTTIVSIEDFHTG